MPDPAYRPENPDVPVFFLSYARARTDGVGLPHDSNQHVVTLFNDLVEHLNQLVGARAGAAIGFIDREMRPGAFWSEQLRLALGTCRIFLPLVSAPYFRSEWCGREWGGFMRREVTQRTGHAPQINSAIIPVAWAPNADGWRPQVARRVQQFSPDSGELAALYDMHGVYGLLALGRKDDYKAVTWDLAKRIQQTYYSCDVAELEFKEENEVEDAFSETVKP